MDTNTRHYEELRAQRTHHLEAADECLAEMNRFQGEQRLLKEQLSTQKIPSPSVSVVGEDKPKERVKS